jgi:hypothetical protein
VTTLARNATLMEVTVPWSELYESEDRDFLLWFGEVCRQVADERRRLEAQARKGR